MRILIIGLNYLPESTSIGPYTADLAEYLPRRGHAVSVVTGFPMAPQWRVWDGYRGKGFMREKINGISVLRTYLYVPERPRRALNRILFDMSFTVSSLLGGLTTGAADAVVVISPPLQSGIVGWLLGLLKRAPVFLHIQDLVPDAAIATGMLDPNGLAARTGRAMERFVYRRVAGIGVICDGFVRNLARKGVPAEKIALLPNYIDLGFIQPRPRMNAFRMQYGIAEKTFVAMYSGSVALKQGLETFVDAAAEFGPGDDVLFCLIGEGPYLPELKARAEASGARNIMFLPLQPRELMPLQLSAADALVITQRRSISDVVFPGKLLYYMAAARPLVAAVSADSETGRFISDQEVGVVVPPEEPSALADAIRRLRSDPSRLEILGANARRTVEEQFNREKVLERFALRLESLQPRKR